MIEQSKRFICFAHPSVTPGERTSYLRPIKGVLRLRQHSTPKTRTEDFCAKNCSACTDGLNELCGTSFGRAIMLCCSANDFLRSGQPSQKPLRASVSTRATLTTGGPGDPPRLGYVILLVRS